MSKVKAPSWKELPVGGIMIEPGSAKSYKTGDWRTQRPVVDHAKCISCLTCWIFCPDSAILVEDGKMKGFDYEHCKGCGICANECPPKVQAISMKKESDFH